MAGAVALGPRQAAVVAHLREHPGLTSWELGRVFGTRNSMIGVLRSLEQKAQVVAVTRWEPQQGRNVARWQVAPPGTVPPQQPPADSETAIRVRERDRLSQRARRARARGLPVQPGIEAPSLRDRPAFAAPLAGAACGPGDTDLFFGPEAETAEERRSREAKAISICADCPVRPACLARALANREQHGVWGGVSFPIENRTRERKAS
jgi:WhiB family transcriptional regulator, redox-sensing transcriptional regulator